MKKRRLFSLFLSFALLLPLFSLTSADAYEDFTLDAKAGLLDAIVIGAGMSGLYQLIRLRELVQVGEEISERGQTV